MNILDVEMFADNDADAKTIGEYFVVLLSRLWEEGEGFSGKRPLGNSGWEHDLYAPLVRAGLIDGSFEDDDNHYLEDYDEAKGNQLIFRAIESLYTPKDQRMKAFRK